LHTLVRITENLGKGWYYGAVGETMTERTQLADIVATTKHAFSMRIFLAQKR
jgi:hypothetical protein